MSKIKDFYNCSICGEHRRVEDLLFYSRLKDPWDLRTRQEICQCKDKPGEKPAALAWMYDSSYNI